jgi:hypothetical protein
MLKLFLPALAETAQTGRLNQQFTRSEGKISLTRTERLTDNPGNRP